MMELKNENDDSFKDQEFGMSMAYQCLENLLSYMAMEDEIESLAVSSIFQAIDGCGDLTNQSCINCLCFCLRVADKNPLLS